MRKILVCIIGIVALLSMSIVSFVGCKGNKNGNTYAVIEVGGDGTSTSASLVPLATKGSGDSFYNTKEEMYDFIAKLEVVVDKKGVVVAINGLDQDGKMLVDTKVMVNKPLKQVVVEVMNNGKALGLVSNISVHAGQDGTNVSVHVDSKFDGEYEQAITEIKKGLDQAAKELNVKIKTNTYRISKEVLIKIAKASDGSLDEEVLKKMTQDELYNVIQSNMKARADYVSKRIDDFYKKMSEEALIEVKLNTSLKRISNEEKEKIQAYKDAMKALEKAKDKVNKAYADAYQKVDKAQETAINKLNNAYKEVVKVRKEYDEKYNKGELTDKEINIIKNEVKLALDTINTINTAVDGAFNIAIKAIETTQAIAIAAINTAESAVDVAFSTLPQNIRASLQINAKDTKELDNVNAKKKEIFNLEYEAQIDYETNRINQLKAQLKIA